MGNSGNWGKEKPQEGNEEDDEDETEEGIKSSMVTGVSIVEEFILIIVELEKPSLSSSSPGFIDSECRDEDEAGDEGEDGKRLSIFFSIALSIMVREKNDFRKERRERKRKENNKNNVVVNVDDGDDDDLYIWSQKYFLSYNCYIVNLFPSFTFLFLGH